MPTGFASTGANPHTQSFEEIYGIPENFLEIEVRFLCVWKREKERGKAREQMFPRGGAYEFKENQNTCKCQLIRLPKQKHKHTRELPEEEEEEKEEGLTNALFPHPNR